MRNNGISTIDLGGTWRVESSCGTWRFDMNVPGSIFAELEKHGAFGPEGAFWRENNRLCQDMAERDFTLTRFIELPPDFPLDERRDSLWLECDGLDTLAEIRINGALAGKADNMHRAWRYPAGSFLKPGANELTVILSNSLKYCREKAAKRPLWQTYENNPELAAPHFNQIRKSHCSYGWDWGPVVPDAGIWKEIRLVAYGDWRLDSVSVSQKHGPDGSVTLGIAPEILPARASRGEYAALPATLLVAEACAAGYRLTGTLIHPDGAVQLFSLDGEKPLELAVTEPKLWWPAGLGERPLYDLSVTLTDPEGVEIGRKDLRVGLRTLTIRQDPDQWGETFEFACNGVPFFARGANYIPEDIYLSRVSPERTRRLLEDCALANFNAVRVWGGGVYPSEAFYAACDELGLVVWQDLMFACAVYDVDNPDFMSNIAEEVRDNVRRIRHHPSLGLVCGNNEMEIAFVAWGIPQTPGQRAEYLEQYQVRFPEILAREAPQVFYWPASPSSTGSFDDPNAPDVGDCHYWDVWHGYKDFHDFTRHYFRFMSEFGFESYPDLKTVESFTLPEDRVQGSPVLEDHQRCVLGTVKLAGYLARYFRSPKDFPSLVLASQINQAEAIRTGIEHWRRNRGRCMGSIYWQLNDNWPVNSWSSIDSAGRWKLLHYAVKRAYAPLVASVEALLPVTDGDGAIPTSNAVPASPSAAGNPGDSAKPGDHPPADSPRVAIHLSNEAPVPASGALTWSLVTVDGKVIDAGAANFDVPAFTSVSLVEFDFAARLGASLGDRRVTPRREGLLFYSWKMSDGTGAYACHAFAPWKSVELRPAAVSVSLGRDGQGRRTIELAADRPALFATVSSALADLLLDDNGVPLDGKEARVLTVLRGGEDLDDARFAEGLSVTHLRDTY